MHARSTRSRSTICLFAAAGVAVLTAAGGVRADLSAAFSPDAWYFEVTHMPDFDQRRDDLPADGQGYCAPTSSMNLLAYFARHGNPGIRPGSANWFEPGRYDEMTDHLESLGQEMGTHSVDGTTMSGTENGLRSWLPAGTTVNARYTIEHWSPRHQEIGQEAALYGGYVLLAIGWYSEAGSTITRDGGHQVMVASGARSGSARELGFRDPASDEGDGHYQSMFTEEFYEIIEGARAPVYGGQALPPRQMMKVVNYGSDERPGYVDGSISVFPNFAITDLEEEGELVMIQPHAEAYGGQMYRILPGFDTPICYAVYGPDGSFLVKTCPDAADAAAPDLYHGHPGADDWTLLDPTQSFICIDVVLAAGRVYLVDENQGVVCYDLVLREVTNAVLVPGWRGLDSMAYIEPDDVGGPRFLYMFSRSDQRMMRMDADTLDPQTLEMLPINGLPMIPHGSQIEPFPGRSDRLWVWTPESNQAFLIQFVGGTGTVQALTPFPFDVVAFAPGDDGRVLVSGDGAMHEYVMNMDGNIQLDPDSLYEGQPAGRVLARSRSSSNFDPSLHVGPEWNHVLPTQFSVSHPDCLGDLDFDGRVGFSDLVEILAQWGTGDIYADIGPDGGDGVVDFQDLLELLGAWGPCE